MKTYFNSSNSSSPVSVCSQNHLMINLGVWVTVYCLYIPIFMLVLYIGFKKWKKRHSGNFSHSDVFTLNVILMEICGIVGSVLLVNAVFLSSFGLERKAAAGLLYLNSLGQGCFQSLTCVDRYLAVVFPVRYLRLRKGRGVTVRNISIAFVWLLCIGRTVSLQVNLVDQFVEPISSMAITVLAAGVVTFCCISVLCVLIRPKPGETGVDRNRVDQSKRRAVNTMGVILTSLLLKLTFDMGYYFVILMGFTVDKCLLFLVVFWFGLPNSLVLPLLFLYRAGTLNVCTM